MDQFDALLSSAQNAAFACGVKSESSELFKQHLDERGRVLDAYRTALATIARQGEALAMFREEKTRHAETIERQGEELAEARKIVGQGSISPADENGVRHICLGFHPETADGPGEYQWLAVVPESKFAALTAERDAAQRALKEIVHLPFDGFGPGSVALLRCGVVVHLMRKIAKDALPTQDISP
jgi:hypothetical protein